MMERLEHGFDAAERVSHADLTQTEIEKHVSKHLAEVRAFESQSLQLLKKSVEIAGNESLELIYRKQRVETEEHIRLVEERMGALGTDRSGLKDTALAAAGLNWSLFFRAQSDTPAKLAAFVYAFLHLQIGGYELLKRTAHRAGDAKTQQLCEQILRDKRKMSDRLQQGFDEAVQATLEAVQA